MSETFIMPPDDRESVRADQGYRPPDPATTARIIELSAPIASPPGTPEWHLDDATISAGLSGVAAARRALSAINPAETAESQDLASREVSA